jgi:hypothetical protein
MQRLADITSLFKNSSGNLHQRRTSCEMFSYAENTWDKNKDLTECLLFELLKIVQV